MFGSTLSGRPVRLSNQVADLKFVIEYDNIQLNKPTHYLSIFLLPGIPFDSNYTALIYYQFKLVDDSRTASDFRLLGGLNATKQSGIFKLQLGNFFESDTSTDANDVDMDLEDITGGFHQNINSNLSLSIGISVESNEQALVALNTLSKPQNHLSQVPKVTDKTISPANDVDIINLSNKIITNAYNFLSSFVDSQNKVPLGKFNDWWNKFKVKLANDKDYLEKL